MRGEPLLSSGKATLKKGMPLPHKRAALFFPPCFSSTAVRNPTVEFEFEF